MERTQMALALQAPGNPSFLHHPQCLLCLADHWPGEATEICIELTFHSIPPTPLLTAPTNERG
jgi:hypothetical protein